MTQYFYFRTHKQVLPSGLILFFITLERISAYYMIKNFFKVRIQFLLPFQPPFPVLSTEFRNANLCHYSHRKKSGTDEKELKGRQAQKVFCFFQIIVIYTAVHRSKAVSETCRPGPMSFRAVLKLLPLTQPAVVLCRQQEKIKWIKQTEWKEPN